MSNDNTVLPSDIKRQPLSERKKVAKDLYFGYASIVSISERLDCKLPTVKSWVYGQSGSKSGGWKVERETAKVQLLKDLSKDKRGMVFNMVDGCLFLLHGFVENSKKVSIETGKTIDIKTAEKLTNILGNLSKIVEKEGDASEDGTFTAPTSPKELQTRVIKADPFSKEDDILEVTPIEIKEVTDEETINDDDDIILD